MIHFKSLMTKYTKQLHIPVEKAHAVVSEFLPEGKSHSCSVITIRLIARQHEGVSG